VKVLHWLAGAAFLGLASSASAATFVVSDVEFPNLVNIHLVGTLPGGPSYDYEQGGGPIFLTGQVNGAGLPETILAYCDDIPHHIYGGAGQHIVYTIGTISQNNEFDNPATNPTLTVQVANNISGLARLGYQAYQDYQLTGNTADLVDEGVIQGAIWIEEYPSLVADPTNPTRYDQPYGAYDAVYLQGRLDHFLGLNFNGPALPQLLNINRDGLIDIQGQIPVGLSVPEPAAWTTMLIGFFGMGGLLRRRRALGAI
jgi:hypothetical protein